MQHQTKEEQKDLKARTSAKSQVRGPPDTLRLSPVSLRSVSFTSLLMRAGTQVVKDESKTKRDMGECEETAKSADKQKKLLSV